MRLALLLMVVLGVSGCVTSAPSSEPARQMSVMADADRALDESLALLMQRGYVITMADGGLGRIDASLARSPGYRVEVRVTESTPSGASIALQAFRGGRLLPAAVVEPLFVELQRRLAEAP